MADHGSIIPEIAADAGEIGVQWFADMGMWLLLYTPAKSHQVVAYWTTQPDATGGWTGGASNNGVLIDTASDAGDAGSGQQYCCDDSTIPTCSTGSGSPTCSNGSITCSSGQVVCANGGTPMCGVSGNTPKCLYCSPGTEQVLYCKGQNFYAPSIIPYTTSSSASCSASPSTETFTINYTLSSFQPYQSTLMSFPITIGNGASTCGSSCVDLLSDSSNCGTCGHGCKGGACTGGIRTRTAAR
jgi:hypothetical protein